MNKSDRLVQKIGNSNGHRNGLSGPDISGNGHGGAEALITLVSVAFILAAYYYFLALFSVDIPRVDDYSNILLFLSDYLSAADWRSKFALVFSHHNEHITALNRIITVVCYRLFGDIDFRVLVYIGNVSVLAIFALLASQLPRDNNRWALTLLAALLVLQPQAWVTALWAMTAISNYAVWPVGFLALVLVNSSQPTPAKLLAGFIVALTACFIQGNGFLVFLLCPIVLAIRSNFWRHWWPANAAESEQVNWRLVMLAVVWLLCALVLYKWVLAVGGGSALKKLNDAAFGFLLGKPHQVFVYYLSVTGSFFAKEMLSAALIGFVGFAYTFFIGIDYLRGGNRNSFTLFVIYAALSLLVVSLFRSFWNYQKGADVIRYYFYSQVFWSCLILEAMIRINRHLPPVLARSALVLMLVLALLVNVGTYLRVSVAAEDQKADLLLGMKRWLYSGKSLSTKMPVFVSKAAEEKLVIAMDKGFYSPYDNYPNYVGVKTIEQVDYCEKQRAIKVDGEFELATKPGAYLLRVAGWVLVQERGIARRLVLCAKQRSYELPTVWTHQYLGPADIDFLKEEIYSFELLVDAKLIGEPIHSVAVLMPKSGFVIVPTSR